MKGHYAILATYYFDHISVYILFVLSRYYNFYIIIIVS